MRPVYSLILICVALVIAAPSHGPVVSQSPSTVVFVEVAKFGRPAIGQLDYSPAGDLILTVDFTGSIVINDESLAVWQVLDPPSERFGTVADAAWNADGTRIAVMYQQGYSGASGQTVIHIWTLNPDTTRFEASFVYTIEQPYTNRLIWNPTGRNEIALAGLFEIEVWAVESGSLLLAQSTPTASIPRDMSWSPNGTYIAFTADRVIYFWNTINQTIDYTIGDDVPGHELRWSADSTQLAANIGNAVQIFDVVTGLMVFEVVTPNLAFDWKADKLLVVSRDTGLRLIDVATATTIYHDTASPVGIIDLKADGTGFILASGIALQRRDTQTNMILAERTGYVDSPAPHSMSWLDNDENIAVMNIGDDTLQLWQVSDGTVVQHINAANEIPRVIARPNSNGFALGRPVTIWEFEDDYFIENRLESAESLPFGWDATGRYLAYGDRSQSYILDTDSMQTIASRDEFSYTMQWHPSNLQLAQLTGDETSTQLRVLDGVTLTPLVEADFDYPLYRMRWGYNGQDLLLGGRPDGYMMVVDPATGDVKREIYIAGPNADRPSTKIFEAHPTQPWIAIAVAGVAEGEDVLTVWDYQTGMQVATISQAIPFESAAWNSTGTQLATLHYDGIRIWEEVGPPPAPYNLQWDGVQPGADNAVGFTFQDDGSSDDDFRQEDGFEVEWRGGWQGTFSDWMPYDTLPANPGTGSVPFELAQPIACEYGIIQVRVRAFYDTQPRLHSEWSNTAEVNLPCDDPTLPSPSNLVIDGANALPVVITWTDNASDEQGHRIERSVDGGAFTEIGTQGPDSTTYTDFTAICGVNYAYRVRVERDGFVSIPSNVVSVSVPCNAAYWQAYPSGAATGPTDARANCAINRAYVQASLVIEDPYAQHELSVVFSTSTDVYHSQRMEFLPNMLNPGQVFPVQIYYHNYPTTTIPEYPLDAVAGSPLPISGVVLTTQLRNLETGACNTIVADYYCQSGTATIISNEPTCTFE